MQDQAFQLRNLAFQAARQRQAEIGPAPRLVVISGGKGGVGVTTLAVNLSVALSMQGGRIVLVDADLYRADVATLCGLADQHNVSDVAQGRRDIHEVLERGPGGIQVVPGSWAPNSIAEYSESSQQRLIRQLTLLGRHADAVMIDVGGGPGEVVQRFFQAAQEVILVTTPEPVSVMDTYATIKTLLHDYRGSIKLVVNRVSSKRIARDVHYRVDRSCRRFLGLRIDLLGWIAADEEVPASACRPSPLVISRPDSLSAKSITKMALRIAAEREAHVHPQKNDRAAA